MSYNGDKYQQKKILNHGPLSLLITVIEKGNENKEYALKFIKIHENSDKNFLKQNYENEIKVREKIKCKYVVEIKDYFYDEINEGYCIVMEYCDGNLRKIIKEYPKGLPLNLIKKIFSQLNEALEAMVKIN